MTDRPYHPDTEVPLISDIMLDAYIDDELEAPQRRAVERHIAQDPAAADYVLRGRQMRHDLRAAFDPQISRPLSPRIMELAHRLSQRLEGHSRRREFTRGLRRFAIAASVAIGVVGASLLGLETMGRNATGGDMLALFGGGSKTVTDQSLQNMQGDVLPAETIAVSTDQETGAAGIGNTSPDFSSLGFSLSAARVLEEGETPAMQLVYENETGARVELFYSPTEGATRDSVLVIDDGPVTILTWSADGRTYNLVGTLERERLLELGRIVNGEWTQSLPGAAASDDADDEGVIDEPAALPESSGDAAPESNGTET